MCVCVYYICNIYKIKDDVFLICLSEAGSKFCRFSFSTMFFSHSKKTSLSYLTYFTLVCIVSSYAIVIIHISLRIDVTCIASNLVVQLGAVPACICQGEVPLSLTLTYNKRGLALPQNKGNDFNKIPEYL